MDAKTALNLAQELLAHWNLSDWQIGISPRMNRTAGKCRHRSKLILLSHSHIQLNSEEVVLGTVKHEIAHGLVGPGHGHDALWKRTAILVGAKPVRCVSAITPPGKWIAICPSCAKNFNFYKKPRKTLRHWCRRCGPELGLLAFVPRLNPSSSSS